MKKTTNGNFIYMKASLELSLRRLRREGRRLIQIVRYRDWAMHSQPILFCNSFPKSGTHLLTQVLSGFTKLAPVVESGLPAVVTYDSSTGEQRSEADIINDLNHFKPGDIGYGHLHATAAITAWLCRDGVIPYFILRDPRDVVVSHVHYITEMAPDHIHHQYYTQDLQTFEDRLKASILGRQEMGGLFPSIRERFMPYLPWLERKEVLTLHYEDFLQNRNLILRRVLEHALERGFKLSKPMLTDQAVEILSSSIDPKRSPTFRQGKAGGWKEAFTPSIKQLFKEITGDLLIQLGYEKDDQW